MFCNIFYIELPNLNLNSVPFKKHNGNCNCIEKINRTMCCIQRKNLYLQLTVCSHLQKVRTVRRSYCGKYNNRKTCWKSKLAFPWYNPRKVLIFLGLSAESFLFLMNISAKPKQSSKMFPGVHEELINKKNKIQKSHATVSLRTTAISQANRPFQVADTIALSRSVCHSHCWLRLSGFSNVFKMGQCHWQCRACLSESAAKCKNIL